MAKTTTARPAAQDHKPKAKKIDPDKPVKFKYDGKTWTVTPSDMDDQVWLDMVGQSVDNPAMSARAMRRLLGPEQADQAIACMQATYGDKVKTQDAGEWYKGLLARITDPNS